MTPEVISFTLEELAHFKRGFSAGYAQAREDAAKVAEAWDINGWTDQENLTAAIRALKPGEEK